MTTWHTSETIRDEWEDADQVPDATLAQLVVAARDAVIAYAPPLPPVEEVAFPNPLTVEVDENGVVGTIVLARQPGQVLRLSVDLTNQSGEAIEDWWGTNVTDEVDFGVPYQCANNYGGQGWAYLPNGGSGFFVFGHTGGTWDDEARVTFDLLATPATPDPEPVESIPDRYRLAQLIQVRNLWNATMTTASGDLGGDTFQITPRPLDWHVKALLRPAQGRPRVR